MIVTAMLVFLACSCSRGGDSGSGNTCGGARGGNDHAQTDSTMKEHEADRDRVHSPADKTKTHDSQGEGFNGALKKEERTKPGIIGWDDMLEKPQVEMPQHQ